MLLTLDCAFAQNGKISLTNHTLNSIVLYIMAQTNRIAFPLIEDCLVFVKESYYLILQL